MRGALILPKGRVSQNLLGAALYTAAGRTKGGTRGWMRTFKST